MSNKCMEQKKMPLGMRKWQNVACVWQKNQCWDNKPETEEKQLFGSEQLFNGAFIEHANAPL